MSEAIDQKELQDCVIFQKKEKPDGTLVALTWAPLVMVLFCLPQASSPLEATIIVIVAVTLKWVARALLLYSKARGYRTITLRSDSLTVENKGKSSIYPLSSIATLFRKRSKYTGAVECGILFDYRLTVDSGEKIRFQTNDPLPQLVKRVGCRLAEELRAKLQADGNVDWVPGVTIQADGIKLPVAGMLTRTRPLKWEQLREIIFKAHQALVYVHGKRAIAARIDMNHPNFFPGLYLVDQLVEQAKKPGVARVYIPDSV